MIPDGLVRKPRHLALGIFGVTVIGLGGYGYYRGRLSRSELTSILVGAVAWIAYAIEGASTFLPVPQFVSSFLAMITGISFIGLFLYGAYSRESETND